MKTSVLQCEESKFPTFCGKDASGIDPGLPKISVLWRREIPRHMSNMEDTVVRR